MVLLYIYSAFLLRAFFGDEVGVVDFICSCGIHELSDKTAVPVSTTVLLFLGATLEAK